MHRVHRQPGAGKYGPRRPGQEGRTSDFADCWARLRETSLHQKIEPIGTLQRNVLFNTQLSSNKRKGQSQILKMKREMRAKTISKVAQRDWHWMWVQTTVKWGFNTIRGREVRGRGMEIPPLSEKETK